MAVSFYVCKHCGNLVYQVEGPEGMPVICCGEEMKLLKAGTTDAAVEKHVPVVAVEGNIVNVAVGSVAHPMQEVHYIEWIAIVTSEGVQIKYLKPGEEPKASFAMVEGETLVEAYAYCNLHGLWKNA